MKLFSERFPISIRTEKTTSKRWFFQFRVVGMKPLEGII